MSGVEDRSLDQILLPTFAATTKLLTGAAKSNAGNHIPGTTVVETVRRSRLTVACKISFFPVNLESQLRENQVLLRQAKQGKMEQPPRIFVGGEWDDLGVDCRFSWLMVALAAVFLHYATLHRILCHSPRRIRVDHAASFCEFLEFLFLLVGFLEGAL